MDKASRKFVQILRHQIVECGFKNTSNVILAVDINKCIADGIIFYKSSNNVILTEGINGIIPNQYIIKL
jgi:2'-phosphotransferase